MALAVKELEDALKAMPKTTDKPPAANLKAAQEMAKVLEKYFKKALAGAAVVTLSATTLAPILKPTLDSNTFLDKLGTSIQLWAATWSWAGPGLIGAPGSTVVLGPVLDVKLKAFVVKALADKSNPPKDFTVDFAKEIHTWATTPSSILVNLVNSSGTVVPTPVT